MWLSSDKTLNGFMCVSEGIWSGSRRDRRKRRRGQVSWHSLHHLTGLGVRKQGQNDKSTAKKTTCLLSSVGSPQTRLGEKFFETPFPVLLYDFFSPSIAQ